MEDLTNQKQLTKPQRVIYERLKKGESVIITGFQETGKTMILKKYARWAQKENKLDNIYFEDDIGCLDSDENDHIYSKFSDEDDYHRRDALRSKLKSSKVKARLDKIIEMKKQKVIVCAYTPEVFSQKKYFSKFNSICYLRRPIVKDYDYEGSDHYTESDED
jgi:predicted AAA+ superfamily ATPase